MLLVIPVTLETTFAKATHDLYTCSGIVASTSYQVEKEVAVEVSALLLCDMICNTESSHLAIIKMARIANIYTTTFNIISLGQIIASPGDIKLKHIFYGTVQYNYVENFSKAGLL